MLQVVVKSMSNEQLQKRRRAMRDLIKDKVANTPDYRSEKDPSWEKFVKKIDTI
jgi:hypothetical protein